MKGVPVVLWTSASGGTAGGSWISTGPVLLVEASLVEYGRRNAGDELGELGCSVPFPFSCLLVDSGSVWNFGFSLLSSLYLSNFRRRSCHALSRAVLSNSENGLGGSFAYVVWAV
jgi:hypothetical protein